MPPKLGPTGQFPYGGPAMPGDRGGIYMGFQRIPGHRLYGLSFGTVLLFMIGTKAESMTLAQMMRRKVVKDFGILPYDASTLPLTVTAKPELNAVEIRMPSACPMVVANPEMWLALAERIEEECAKLGG